MATIQLGNTKVASKLINYCEKRAIEKSGIEVNPDYAKSQFKMTRELWGKTSGIQAHHVIQSFKPGEISPKMANEVGKDLAKELGKGHEALIYTHSDTKHIHNHIVINAVNFEDGKKYQSRMKDLYRAREISDRLCKERDLHITKEPTSKLRYTLSEKNLIEKGKYSWKDEIRKSINIAKENASNYKEFKDIMTKDFGFELREGKYLTYTHPDNKNWKVRGKTLGLNYERGTIEHDFSRKVERGTESSGGTKPITENVTTRDREPYKNDSSRPSSIYQPSESSDRKVGAERQKKVRVKSQSQRFIQGINPGNEEFKSQEYREAGDNISNYGEGDQENRGQSPGDGEANNGYAIQDKTDPQSQLEGKGETIFPPATDNSGIDSGDTGGLPTGNVLDDVLKSLEQSIKKANAIEKAQAEQKQKALQRKSQVKKKSHSRFRGRER